MAITIRLILLVVAVSGLLIATVLVPWIRDKRIRENESSAVGALRFVAVSQAQFQAAAIVDQDRDGVGEFGFFTELSGELGYRLQTGTSAGPVSPPFIWPGFGQSAASNQGVGSKNAYFFRMFLPRAEGQSAMAEPGTPPGGNPVHADAQELRFIALAWPQVVGQTGNRAFAVSQGGEVFHTVNLGVQNYSGTENMPDAGAALVDPLGRKNLEGLFITDDPGTGDGCRWVPSGG